jgi:hypothetical protein
MTLFVVEREVYPEKTEWAQTSYGAERTLHVFLEEHD